MDPTTLKRHLQSLCQELDRGRDRFPVVTWVGAALVAGSATVALEGCDATDANGVPPTEEVCDDFSDNDEDGEIDCLDEDCADDPACASVLEYGAPAYDEGCEDDLDNDHDGDIDCDDED